MARKNALLTEVFIFISCGLVLVSNGQGCLPNPGNLESLVDHSPIVLEGRVEETRPSASQPADSGLVDAVISLVTVFKGQVDSGSQERIVVGPFGASESTQICVGEARGIGDELVLFLSASGDESAEVGALRHFRLVANPVVADAESRRMLQEHASPSISNPHVTRCDEPLYCQNGGTCYIMLSLGRRFCKCAPGFQSNICQEKVTTNFGATRMHDGHWMREYFFLIIIGSAAVFFVLIATCILLVVFVRCRPMNAKPVEMSGIRGIKYRNVSTDLEKTGEKTEISTSWSKIGFKNDSAKAVSLPGGEDSTDDRHHSNGGGKLRTNVVTSDDNANLLRPQKPQDVREPGLHRGRTGQNGPLKTGDLPVPRVPVVSASLRGRDLQKNRESSDGNRGRNGVWISRPLTDEGSMRRGQRLAGVTASRDSDLDSIPV